MIWSWSVDLAPILKELSGIRSALRGIAMCFRKPVLFVRLKTQEPSTMALVYAVTAGAPVDADVVSRELTVVVGGSQVSQTTYTGSTTDLGEVTVEQDSEVTLSLVDIDDAGNRSEAAVYGPFMATDTIAPAQPGSFGVTLVREE